MRGNRRFVQNTHTMKKIVTVLKTMNLHVLYNVLALSAEDGIRL